jgi:hypothetical protein
MGILYCNTKDLIKAQRYGNIQMDTFHGLHAGNNLKTSLEY